MALIRRLGNKSKIASEITKNFPKHTTYIELFCGALGMFYNKRPVAKRNFLNDIDKDISNLFTVLLYQKKELKEIFKKIPYHEMTFNWLKTEGFENDNLMKAVRFLYLSNFSYLGKSDSLGFNINNTQNNLIENIDESFNLLRKSNCQFLSKDFRKVIKSISLKEKDKEIENAFIYSDPPYLQKTNNYSDSFKEQDTIDLFDLSVESGIRFAISEFNNPFILKLAKERNLNVIPICERRTVKNRNVEILITNYKKETSLF